MEGKEGYKKLVVWRNSKTLRAMVYQITASFPKSELRRVSQMRDAARSVKQNIQEGYQRHSLAEYIRGLDISKASLAELQGDIEDCREDGVVTEQVFTEAFDLCKRTDYLFMRLLQSLRQKSRDAKGRSHR